MKATAVFSPATALGRVFSTSSGPSRSRVLSSHGYIATTTQSFVGGRRQISGKSTDQTSQSRRGFLAPRPPHPTRPAHPNNPQPGAPSRAPSYGPPRPPPRPGHHPPARHPAGHHRPGHNQYQNQHRTGGAQRSGGYNQGGYNQGSYNQGGYNQGGYNQGGYNQRYNQRTPGSGAPRYGNQPGYGNPRDSRNPREFGEPRAQQSPEFSAEEYAEPLVKSEALPGSSSWDAFEASFNTQEKPQEKTLERSPRRPPKKFQRRNPEESSPQQSYGDDEYSYSGPRVYGPRDATTGERIGKTAVSEPIEQRKLREQQTQARAAAAAVRERLNQTPNGQLLGRLFSHALVRQGDGSLSEPQSIQDILSSLNPGTHSLIMLMWPTSEERDMSEVEPELWSELQPMMDSEEKVRERLAKTETIMAEAGPDEAVKAKFQELRKHYPVCAIVDLEAATQGAIERMQKEKQTEKEREKAAKKLKNRSKELELNWAIDPHDLGHRLKTFRNFLAKGMFVEIRLMRKSLKGGRKQATEQEAEEVLRRIREIVSEVPGSKESKPAEGLLLQRMTLHFEGPREE